MTAAELAAVASGVAYILLAIRERRACWVAGGISTAISGAVFLEAGLPMQAALQLVYVGMSAYGWLAWRRATADARPIQSWPWTRHLAAAGAIAAATAISAPLTARYALAALPVADSLGTWASLWATWLLARRVVENWAWWIAIDAGLAALFAHQGLWLMAALYLGYAALAVAGWRAWHARRTAA